MLSGAVSVDKPPLPLEVLCQFSGDDRSITCRTVKPGSSRRMNGHPYLPASLAVESTGRPSVPSRLTFFVKVNGYPTGSVPTLEIPLRERSQRPHPISPASTLAESNVPAVVLMPERASTGCEASIGTCCRSAGVMADERDAPVVRLIHRDSPPGRPLARGHYHMDRVRDLAKTPGLNGARSRKRRHPGPGFIAIGEAYRWAKRPRPPSCLGSIPSRRR